LDDALLAALLEKYRELLDLRTAQDDAEPRLRLRKLAARFPGALRELDALPMDELRARRDALAAAREGAPLPPWAAWMAGYHAWLRVALRLKRARGPGDLDGQVARACGAYSPEHADEPRRLSAEDVRAMLAPPGGRLSRWALRRVAREHGVAEEAVAGALMARRA
jgi:hypothetical protein